NHPTAYEIADLIGGEFGAGKNREHTQHLGGRLDVDRLDCGVSVRGTEEISVSLAWPVDIVGVVTGPGDEAAVFFAAHRGADTGRAPGLRPPGNRALPIRRLGSLRRSRAWHARPQQSP